MAIGISKNAAEILTSVDNSENNKKLAFETAQKRVSEQVDIIHKSEDLTHLAFLTEAFKGTCEWNECLNAVELIKEKMQKVLRKNFPINNTNYKPEQKSVA